jgi:hypothetical protein
MSEITTIQLNKKIVSNLQKIKIHPRQTYNELISDLIDYKLKTSKKNQYSEFLHKIQQGKMKELWDNKEDEDWENV